VNRRLYKEALSNQQSAFSQPDFTAKGAKARKGRDQVNSSRQQRLLSLKANEQDPYQVFRVCVPLRPLR
jgi:hypothetical protein